MKHKFYFIFGIIKSAPYHNGWICVVADSRLKACNFFQKKFPNPTSSDAVNCDFVLTEEEFRNSGMYKNNEHLGHGCHGTFDAETGNELKDYTLSIQNLIIETTRRCNMRCPHCLRGDAENTDMNFETIRPFLESVREIEELTFSGGEPTLNVPIMEQVLEYVKEHNVPIQAFYIVTNGKQVPDDFIMLLHKWYDYCYQYQDSLEYCGVSLSRDDFHEPIPDENIGKLSSFSFFRDYAYTDFHKAYIIDTGRASKEVSKTEYRFRDATNQTELHVFNYDNSNHLQIEDGNVYLSVNGEIVPDCNYAYEDMPKVAVGTTKNMQGFFEYLEKQYK